MLTLAAFCSFYGRLGSANVLEKNKTGTSQVGAISKAISVLFGDKKFEKQSHSAEKMKRGPCSPVPFCRLRLKSKKPKGALL